MIGRKNEIKSLRSACERREAQLIAVYGRRRVGKTYLVRQTFGDTFAFAHTGLGKATMAGQLRKFQESLERYGSPKAEPAKDWIEAFRRLEDVIVRSKMKKSRYAPHTTMITTYGVSRSSYLSGFQSEVTLKDLFMEAEP